MTTPKNVAKVIATKAALALIEQLKAEHGSLMFHQSGGCCDLTFPVIFSIERSLCLPLSLNLVAP